eukprot:XP_003730754.2 PREDICTED: mucin-3A [Strongylocentrotus purpuratus]
MKYFCNSFLFVHLPAIIIIYQVTSSIAGCIRPEIIDPDIELIDDLPLYDDGAVVILLCDTSQSYVGYGPTAMYCSTDTWIPDPSLRECKAPCNAPVVTAGVLHYDAGSGKTGDVYLDNTAIQFACEDTERTTLYHEQGLEKSICTDGSWDSREAPICAESCTAPPNAVPSGLFRHMIEVTFACDPGFQPIGQTEFICIDGQWNGEFSCEAIPSDEPTERSMTEKPQTKQTTKQPATTDPAIVCDFPDTTLLDPDAIVSPMQDGYTLFSLVELSCGGTELTTSDGPSLFACYNRGMWLPSIEDFKCYRPCNAPLASPNVEYITLEGQNVDELYSHNAVIDFICKSEKQSLYGPSLVSCYDGEWNPQQVPTCEDVNPFELKFKITHIDGSPATYKTDYADDESQTFIEMETELVHAIETIYTLLDGYLLSKIVSFSDPGTSGLDVCAVVFIDKSSVSGTLEEVSAETDRILGQSATIDGLSFRFTLDGASVLVSEPCEIPDLLEGIVFESSNEPLENVWYPDSTTFSLSCGDEDYIIDGPTQLVCENGAWVPEGEPICIELQTTSTADVTETLRQTTPIAETTGMTQQTQSTDVQSESPLISAMSTSAFTTSTYTLEPHDTTTPLQTISEISFSDMTTHISASQATTILTVETTEVLTTPEGEITATEDSKLTEFLSTYGNDFTTSGSLGYTASTVTLNSVDDVTTYETVRTDTSVRTDHTTRATDRGISDWPTSFIPTTGDQTSFRTTRISYSSTDSTTATDPNPTTDLQPTKEVSTLISSVSPTLLHTDGTFTSSDASEPTRLMTKSPIPLETTYEEQSATTRTGKSTDSLTTSDEVYTGTFSSSTSGPTLGTERLYTITELTMANTEEEITTHNIEPTIETSTPLTSFPQTPSRTNTDNIGSPKATDSISQTALASITGSSESSDVTTSNAPTESDTNFVTTEFLATSLSDTEALSTTLDSISNLETSQTTQGSTKDSISTNKVQNTTYQETSRLSTNGPSSIPTDLMTTSPDEQFTENALTSRITATDSTTDVTNVVLTTAGEKTVETTDMFSSTITEVTMTNTEEEATTDNLEPTLENSTPLTSFPQTPSRTNTVGIGTPEATDVASRSDSISQTTLVSMTGPTESSDITTSNAPTESFTQILITEFLAASLPDTEALSTTLVPISNSETSQTTEGSTQDSIGSTSAITHVTQFHATIEETEASMTRTTKLGNEATSQMLTEWASLTTVYSDETTVTDLLTTVRRPVTYTTEAYSTDHPTDEPFKTGSARTMTRSDDPTTSEITETTKGVLKTTPHFTSTFRMNSHALTTSQDTQTAEELSTSAFFHPSTLAPTEGGLFSTHETVSAVSDEVTDSDLVTSHSATTPDSFEQTTRMPGDRTASMKFTSTEASRETSSMITDLKTDSNEGYSTATQQTEGSTDVGTTMKTMNSITPVGRLTEKRTTQIKTTAWKTTENDLETEDGVSSPSVMITADERTTEDFTARTTSSRKTSGITPTVDDMSSTTEKETTFERTTEDITSRTTSSLTTSGIAPTADNMSSTTEKETTFERTTEDITSRTTSGLTTSGITPTTDDMSSTTKKETTTQDNSSEMIFSRTTAKQVNNYQSTTDDGTISADWTTAEYIATESPTLPTATMTIGYASTIDATTGDVTSTLHHLTSTKDMPSSSMVTYADTSNPTPKHTVQTTTYQEESSLSTYVPSSTPTDVMMTSAKNALTSRIAATETTTDVTNVILTTAADKTVETTDMFSSTVKENTPGITDSISSSQETVAPQTDTDTVTPATAEATEGGPSTQIHSQEPCKSCNPETETCLDGRCECRPSKYRVFSNDECSETKSFTLTFRILLIEQGQAIFNNDLLDKQSSAFQILQGDLVKSINSIFDDLPSFLGSEIFSFQSGSIIATSLVYFNSNSLVTNDSLTNHIDDVLTTDEYTISSNSSYTLDASNLVIQATNECSLGTDDCSPFSTCSDIDKEGFNCTCIEGYTSISIPSGLHCETVTTTYTTEDLITSTVMANGNSPSIATWILITVSVVGGAFIIFLLVSLICVIRKSSKRKITHPEETLVVPKAKKDNKLEAYRGYYTSFNESIDESTDSVEDTAL